MKINLLLSGLLLAVLSLNAFGETTKPAAAAPAPVVATHAPVAATQAAPPSASAAAAAIANPNSASNPSGKSDVSFKNDVHPILHDYCLSCHSPGGKGFNKSGLDMTSYETLMKGTRFGPVVKPGDPETSTFVMLVEWRARPELHMPPLNGKLYKEHITTLRKWVHQGAKNN